MKALVLRTCNADMTSKNGFIWSTEGPVACPDWDPKPECGNGLHGALWGEGDGSLFNWSPDAVWQVVAIEEWVDLKGKIKFPSGIVVHTGDQKSATEYIIANGAKGAVIGATVSVGDYGIASAGYKGIASAGYKGIASARDYGIASAGYKGIASARDYGIASAGNHGTASAGNHGTAVAGYSGIASVGNYGTASVGNYGTASVGYEGIASAGYKGTANAGDYGIASAGNYGIINIKYWHPARYRIKTGYIGEDGLEPNVKYKLNENFEFVKVDS